MINLFRREVSVFFGLGLGIVFAALIFILGENPPSRVEVENMARTYGMVYTDEVVPLPDRGDIEKAARDLGMVYPEVEGKGAPPQEMNVSVNSGMTLGEISEHLMKQGVIRDAAAFKEMAVSLGMAGRIKAGNYRLLKNSEPFRVIQAITAPGGGH